MNKFIAFIYFTYFISVNLFAQDINCAAVYERYKEQINAELNALELEKQLLERLKKAHKEHILKEDEALQISKKQHEELLEKIALEKRSLELMIKKNEEILLSISNTLDNKVIETFSKMKENKSAIIFENMKAGEAASILFAMSAKDISRILGKMNPQKAAEISEMIRKGPPFNDTAATQVFEEDN